MNIPPFQDLELEMGNINDDISDDIEMPQSKINFYEKPPSRIKIWIENTHCKIKYKINKLYHKLLYILYPMEDSDKQT